MRVKFKKQQVRVRVAIKYSTLSIRNFWWYLRYKWLFIAVDAFLRDYYLLDVEV